MAHPTLHIQRFATHGSPNLTHIIVFNVLIVFMFFSRFSRLSSFYLLSCFFRCSMFSKFPKLSINGVSWICGRCALNGVP